MSSIVYPNRWFLWTVAALLIGGLLIWWAIRIQVFEAEVLNYKVAETAYAVQYNVQKINRLHGAGDTSD